jgi:hypothetical protein
MLVIIETLYLPVKNGATRQLIIYDYNSESGPVQVKYISFNIIYAI